MSVAVAFAADARHRIVMGPSAVLPVPIAHVVASAMTVWVLVVHLRLSYATVVTCTCAASAETLRLRLMEHRIHHS